MALRWTKGCFYEFHRSRAVSRPGAELHLREDVEIGVEISRKSAIRQVANGKDIYTPFRADAYKLAAAAFNGVAPEWDGSHQPEFFPHYHPGGVHTGEGEWEREATEGRPISDVGPGHVYWGQRGDMLKETEKKRKQRNWNLT
ncbi:MAG TPA: hypothetical protein VIM62_09845 [Acidobacteriaceae bacterium]